MEILKTCVRCTRQLPLSAFRKQAACPDGHQNICKLCGSLIAKQRYDSKKEDILKKNIEWGNRNKERRAEIQRKYRERVSQREPA